LTTLILVFRGSPDLPAVRLVQQEPSLLRRAFRGRTLVSLAPDGPWPRLIRFSSCIRSCGYNYPLCRYSLFKDPTFLPIAGRQPLRSERSTARGRQYWPARAKFA